VKEILISPAIFDPFQYGVELPLAAVLHPLGCEMRLKTNSREIVQAAEESWSGFPALFAGKPMDIRVAVSDDQQAPAATGLIWRAQGHLLAMQADQNNFAICDLDRGFAFSWLTPATARDREFVRYFFLDTIVQVLSWQTHLTPRIHASCVARAGRGVLLCGESGAGKSCLAYACARRGWAFITDESAAMVRDSHDRIVLGKPRQMHFRDTAAEIIPELHGRLAKRNAVGKISIAVHTAELPDIQTAFQCSVAAIVFLNRHAGGPARLLRLSAEDALGRLERDLPLFQEPLHEKNRAALRHLVEAGAFELCYRDLEEAVTLLESLTL
jgi:hypothetical protein